MGLSSLPYTPPPLLHLLTGTGNISKTFRQNICACNNSIVFGFVKADTVSRVSNSSTFNLAATVRSQNYHLGTMVLPCDIRPPFVSVYIHDTDFITQNDVRATHIPHSNPAVLARPNPIFSSAINKRGYFSLCETMLRLSGLLIVTAQSLTMICVANLSTFTDIIPLHLQELPRPFYEQKIS